MEALVAKTQKERYFKYSITFESAKFLPWKPSAVDRRVHPDSNPHIYTR